MAKSPLIIKPDRRFKSGHIKFNNGVLRGHPDSVEMKVYELPAIPPTGMTYIDAELFLKAPPIVVTPEMAKVLRKVL